MFLFPKQKQLFLFKKPLDPTLPFLAHKHSHCFKGSTFWASPSTFFMKWKEDHYLETQCAHHAQQKLRNLLSSTGPGWLIGIGFCMAFLTSIPIISLILILRVTWELTSYPTSSIGPILLISTAVTQWLFRSMLHIPPSMTNPWNDPALDTLRVWIDCVATTQSQGYLLFTLTFLPTHRHTWSQVVPNLACSACSQYSPNIAKDILAMPPKLKTSLDLTNTHPKVNQ